VPLINIVDPTHLRVAGLRPLLGIAPQPVKRRFALNLWRDEIARRAAHAAFVILRSLFALRDRFAAARNQVPAAPDMAASTMLAYGAVGIMAAILMHDLIAPAPAQSSVSPMPEKKPEWIEIVRAEGAFALEADELAGLERHYLVRRHRSGGRSDELSFGRVDAPGPYARISAYRPGDEGMKERTALDAVATAAAVSGIQAELEEPSVLLSTKFGAMPIVRMTVPVNHAARNCIAAAGAWLEPRFRLVAWWCNDGPEIVAQGEFACLIDRLALMSAGGDDKLAEFFARAELRRNYCDVHGSFISPTPRLVHDWISDKRRPQLRGRLRGH
jgi:hypothetical protein